MLIVVDVTRRGSGALRSARSTPRAAERHNWWCCVSDGTLAAWEDRSWCLL